MSHDVDLSHITAIAENPWTVITAVSTRFMLEKLLGGICWKEVVSVEKKSWQFQYPKRLSAEIDAPLAGRESALTSLLSSCTCRQQLLEALLQQNSKQTKLSEHKSTFCEVHG